MLDAMAIRQQVMYDQHSGRLVGYVDLGGGDESEEIAKEALVIMAVGLKSKWKAPLSFHFTKGLSAEAQCSLLCMCFDKLLECGMVIHAVTMDGHATNLGMCRLLGCSLVVENFKTWFSIPKQKEPVWVLLDPCHMVKLLRNALEAMRGFKSPRGSILWEHISTLHKVQSTIGLRCANKLTDRHLYFYNQKMKVHVQYIIIILVVYITSGKCSFHIVHMFHVSLPILPLILSKMNIHVRLYWYMLTGQPRRSNTIKLGCHRTVGGPGTTCADAGATAEFIQVMYYN